MCRYLLVYHSKPESEDQMLDDLGRILADNEVDTESTQHFMLAVSEAFTNALVHGNLRDASKLIKLDLRVNKREITADIRDQGRGGLERISTRKPPTPLAESGRGIDLIQHYASNAEFSEDDSGGLIVTIRQTRHTEQKIKG